MKGENFCDCLLLPVLFACRHYVASQVLNLSKMGPTLKGKNMLPRGAGSKFFPFRGDPLSEGRQNNFERVVTLESVSIPLKCY